MDIPEDILTARSFFERAESETDPKRKLYNIKKAIETIESYLEENQDVPVHVKEFIRNLKRAHTRRLLVQLVSINDIDIETWLDYIIVFITKLKDETKYVKEQDQELKKNYNDFSAVWKDVVKEAIESL